jgi:UDP-N-acetyl-D-glucosamine dehydrogenase
MAETTSFERLRTALSSGRACAGVIGLGYVGLPLGVAAARRGMTTLGFDIDPDKTTQLNAGRSYIEAVDSAELKGLVEAGRFSATADFDRLAECDVIVICVPTPLNKHREPDLSFIEITGREIGASMPSSTSIRPST